MPPMVWFPRGSGYRGKTVHGLWFSCLFVGQLFFLNLLKNLFLTEE